MIKLIQIIHNKDYSPNTGSEFYIHYLLMFLRNKTLKLMTISIYI